MARLEAMDEEQREVHAARVHLIEDVLTLKCPRCGQAFLDFDGCFALTCSRCGCGFCGWCLHDCGDDAHRHVANCAFNLAGGEVYSTQEKFRYGHCFCVRAATYALMRTRLFAHAAVCARVA